MYVAGQDTVALVTATPILSWLRNTATSRRTRRSLHKSDFTQSRIDDPTVCTLVNFFTPNHGKFYIAILLNYYPVFSGFMRKNESAEQLIYQTKQLNFTKWECTFFLSCLPQEPRPAISKDV